jgi:hypothetical protein
MSLTWGKVRDFDYQHLAQWAECQVSCGKSEGSPVELPSVFHLPNWKVFVAGIGFWAVIYRLWK